MKPEGTVKSILLHLNHQENTALNKVAESRNERNLSDMLRNILHEEVKRIERRNG